jgi:hypothetical protein
MEDENGGKSRKKRRYYSSDSDSNWFLRNCTNCQWNIA